MRKREREIEKDSDSEIDRKPQRLIHKKSSLRRRCLLESQKRERRERDVMNMLKQRDITERGKKGKEGDKERKEVIKKLESFAVYLIP